MPAMAAKVRTETDWASTKPSGLHFKRHYLSTWGLSDSSHFSTLGKAWRHNHDIELSQRATSTGTTVHILTGEGYVRSFTRPTGASAWAPEGHNDSLSLNVSGQWTYRRAEQDDTLVFNTTGKLLSNTARNGWQTNYTYDTVGRLSSVTDPLGQTLTFAYNSTGQLVSVTAPASYVTTYGYDAVGRLAQVTYPGGTVRVFLYENTAFPHALTGIQDENGNRWGTFAYDAQGRAISTELAGGVQHYQAAYPGSSTGPVAVTDPLGTTRNFVYGVQSGKLAVLSGSSPDPLGQPDAASRVQNAAGLIESQTDFRGTTATTSWDAARRLPLARTEAAGTTDARTTATEWHPQWHLPAKVTEPGRETTYVYDSVGNLLTKSIKDTASNTTRTWGWTYHASGLVATATGPSGAATAYQYDSAGNLTQSTNALGQSTTYTHDAAGRILTQTEPTGTTHTYQYDLRGRLLSHSSAGLASTYTYRPSGQLASTTSANGYAISYQYDAAQRLTGWSDNRGASGTYQLDAMGNRVGENVKDAQGATAWQIARSINSLNRVSSVATGGQTTSYGYDANGDATSQSQNVNGSAQTTTWGLDALRRVQSITDAANATATLHYNALDAITQASDFKGVTTSYTRDALGNAPQEATPDAGTATATHDARGLLASTTDATGRTIAIERDALGRITRLNYSDGTSAWLRYDLAGAAYNAPGAPNASIGHLSEIQDPGATTQYQRDAQGRITRKTQILANGDTRSIATTYIPAGQGGAGSVQAVTYASGKQLVYQYDATGQLTGLLWNGQPLIQNLTWNPLGQPTGWNWPSITGNPAETRQYNTAGQLIHTALLDLTWDSAGRLAAAEQSQMVPGQPSNSGKPGKPPQQARIASAYTYDNTGRLTASAHSAKATPAITWPAGWSLSDVTDYTSMGYSYDANGNRLAAAIVRNAASGTGTSTRTHTIAPGTNRLASIQTITGTSTTTVTYGYDAAGAITNATGSNGAQYVHYGPQGRVAKITASGNAADPFAVSYLYNSASQRITKTDTRTSTTAPKTEHTVYSEEDSAQPLGTYSNQRSASSAAPGKETDSTEVIYLPTASGPLPVAAQINGRLYAIHSDHLNTPRRLTNQQGQVAWQWLLTGFGETAPTTGANGYVQRSASGVPSYAPEVTFNLRYPGQQWDEETGLAYNVNRYYNPLAGRYIQSDPIGLQGGSNRFAYVGGNPLSYVDPLGLGPWDKLYGLPKEFWKWLHKEDGGDLIRAYKDPKTGQVPKEDAKELYEQWKKSKEGGFADPTLLEGLLPWGLTPSPLMCGTLDCHPEFIKPKPTCP